MLNPTRTSFEMAKSEVSFAFERVPFFRAHLEVAGLSPKDLKRPEDFARVPPTTKSHYRRNFPAGVLAEGRTLDEPGLTRIPSSGTGGERLITVIHASSVSERWFTSLSVHPGFTFLTKTRGVRTCSYAAPNCSDVECSNPNATMADRTLPDRTLVLPVYHDLLTTPEAMRDTAAHEIAAYEPHLMYVDATHLDVVGGQDRELLAGTSVGTRLAALHVERDRVDQPRSAVE